MTRPSDADASSDPSSFSTPEAVADAICRAGSLAVLRFEADDPAREAVGALLSGGVTGVEVTMTTPGAIDLISQLAADPPASGMLLGVGSVRDGATARAAIRAGARYVVSPATFPDVIAAAHELGAAALPGAYTPTEITRALELGADLVKVFPADTLGPGYIKAVRAAMPDLRLVPTGGVTPDNAGDWVRAGAAAVGLGSALVDKRALRERDFAALTDLARTLTDNIRAARA